MFLSCCHGNSSVDLARPRGWMSHVFTYHGIIRAITNNQKLVTYTSTFSWTHTARTPFRVPFRHKYTYCTVTVHTHVLTVMFMGQYSTWCSLLPVKKFKNNNLYPIHHYTGVLLPDSLSGKRKKYNFKLQKSIGWIFLNYTD